MILTHEQEMIRDSMRAFAQERLAPSPPTGTATIPSRPRRSRSSANSARWAWWCRSNGAARAWTT